MTLLKNPVDRVWLMLVAATLVTWWIGEGGWASSGGFAAVALMFGLAFVKGTLIALDFMETRHAPPLWRRLLLGWLAGVIGLIGLAWWIARWRTGG
jgi:hypothetical protein